MPKGYGVPTSKQGLLAWREANKRFSDARNYWIGTTRSDGRPHAMPVWGVWLDEKLYFGTDRNSRKSRNLLSNPYTVVHLESGDDVVIVEGKAAEVTDAALLDKIDAAYLAKYAMRLTDAPGELIVFAVSARTALAWREKDFPKSATRWSFGES
jgi:general stress protein 26